MKRKLRIYPVILIAIWIGIIWMFLAGCKKECCPETDNPVAPVLTTDTVSAITQTTAKCGGTISSEGGANVTARGVCWSTAQSPTTASNKTSDSSGVGSFTSSITGLTASTTYFVRAYATNSVATAYGNQQSFTTLQSVTIPTVTTNAVTVITQTTATSGGNVTSDGGEPVTAKGVCWSTSPNPATTDSYTTDGSGTGPFTSCLTGLTPNTPYYLRAYATNSAGTAYGDELSFTTLDNGAPCPGMPSFTYDGQVYNTVQIGMQCWMKENLNIGIRIDESIQQTNNSIIEKYCYNNDVSNCDVYGGLYQWDEMMQYITAEGAQGICPDGWHISSDAEWWQLIVYLGGGFVAGGEMKETGTAHWISPNSGATNLSGFTALPGGLYYLSFDLLGYRGIFWSSLENGSASAFSYELYYDNVSVARSDTWKIYGLSIRCIRD